jgi:uncharacterized protein YndB with AHSA1/START domain
MAKQKPYDWTQFILRVYLKAPADKVYAAWTDAKLITRWFPEKAEIEARRGGRIYLEWVAGDKMDTQVIRARKPTLFVFPFGNKGEEVAVKIKKVKGGTICELHQYHMKTGPKDKVSMHMGCAMGWTFFLANLKAFLEHGVDLRGHDPKRCYRQNFINS